ncbi:unnamed protein product [Echinostoma caproni]|uniref:Secreted mucin n=1 Tax=Echinostoma caproni TaxID=27848 RepID=A0A183A6B5_9TREM|nr:unnamed protein product [Echinostoma caproni]
MSRSAFLIFLGLTLCFAQTAYSQNVTGAEELCQLPPRPGSGNQTTEQLTTEGEQTNVTSVPIVPLPGGGNGTTEYTTQYVPDLGNGTTAYPPPFVSENQTTEYYPELGNDTTTEFPPYFGNGTTEFPGDLGNGTESYPEDIDPGFGVPHPNGTFPGWFPGHKPTRPCFLKDSCWFILLTYMRIIAHLFVKTGHIMMDSGDAIQKLLVEYKQRGVPTA